VNRHFTQINREYLDSGGDSTGLFRALLAVGEEIGMDRAYAILEQCVIEKRTAWLERNRERLTHSGDAIQDGYRAFYEVYLGVSMPGDGELAVKTPTLIVTRWWNRCPTLEACQALGLDTREVCRKVYERPVEEFLKHIDPRLSFERNYAAIRPHCAYCEEIISLRE